MNVKLNPAEKPVVNREAVERAEQYARELVAEYMTINGLLWADDVIDESVRSILTGDGIEKWGDPAQDMIKEARRKLHVEGFLPPQPRPDSAQLREVDTLEDGKAPRRNEVQAKVEAWVANGGTRWNSGWREYAVKQVLAGEIPVEDFNAAELAFLRPLAAEFGEPAPDHVAEPREMAEAPFDDVFRPKHYADGHAIEPLAFIEDWWPESNLANVLKYICRWKDKGGLKCLYKARNYLDRYIKLQERKGGAQ